MWSALRCLAAAAVLGGGSAAALEPEAIGLEIDLLPVVASAMQGAPGGSLQVWLGEGRNRLRLVGATLHYPGAFVPAPFQDRRSTAVAVIYDRFFQDGFRGPWVGAGAEYWWSSVGLRDAPDRGGWSGPVATVGAGWVIPVWRGIYLNPWAAAHAPLSSGGVQVGPERFKPRAVEAEVSLKLGWTFTLGR